MNESYFQKSDNPEMAVRAQKNKTETQQQNDRFILMLISSAIVMMKLRLPSLFFRLAVHRQKLTRRRLFIIY